MSHTLSAPLDVCDALTDALIDARAGTLTPATARRDYTWHRRTRAAIPARAPTAPAPRPRQNDLHHQCNTLSPLHESMAPHEVATNRQRSDLGSSVVGQLGVSIVQNAQVVASCRRAHTLPSGRTFTRRAAGQRSPVRICGGEDVGGCHLSSEHLPSRPLGSFRHVPVAAQMQLERIVEQGGCIIAQERLRGQSQQHGTRAKGVPARMHAPAGL